MLEVMSQGHPRFPRGFPRDNNTPSPGSTEWRVRDLALGTVVAGKVAVSVGKTLKIILRRICREVQVRGTDSLMV